jgi:hypothetical protein
VEMQPAEDFRPRVQREEMRTFTDTGLSQKLSDKNICIKLVVVMSAVDWWKTQCRAALAVVLRWHVQWIYVQRFGKDGELHTMATVT